VTRRRMRGMKRSRKRKRRKRKRRMARGEWIPTP
jgi:hypothetical protein